MVHKTVESFSKFGVLMNIVGEGWRAVKYFSDYWIKVILMNLKRQHMEIVLWKSDDFISYLTEIEKMVSFLGP